MPDDEKTVRLDRKWMEYFLNEEVIPFRKKLEALLEDEPGTDAPSMWKLSGGIIDTADLEKVKPLAIGKMYSDNSFAGQSLNDGVKNSAISIHETLKKQIDLFRAVEEDIQEAIEVLFKTQRDSLTEVEGRKFLEHLEDVSDILDEGGETGNSEE